MEPELINAYKNTSYNVLDPPMSIKIGHQNPELDALLERYDLTNWAYVTAFNPFSELLTAEGNEERHEQLNKRLKEYLSFEGEGLGTDPSWKPERRFLILGISEKDAVKLGEDFQQNAIVVGKLKNVSKLMLLRDELNAEH